MRIRQLNHSVYQLQFHIVWGTKYRRKILKPYVREELWKSFKKLQRKYPQWYYHQINTDQDHVHLLIELPPTDSLAWCVQQLKATTSRDLRNKFEFIRSMSEDNGVWSVGYFVSSVGLNENQIKKYIERQGKHDLGQDVTAEFS
jgi:putative transposase